MTDVSLSQARARLGGDSPLWFARFVLIVTALLVFALAIDLGSDGVLFVFWRRTLLVLAVTSLGLALSFAAWWIGRAGALARVESYMGRLKSLLQLRSRPAPTQPTKVGFAGVGAVSNRLLGFFFCAALMLFLFLGPWGKTFESLPARFLLLWFSSLLASLFLAALLSPTSYPLSPNSPLPSPRRLDSLLFTLLVFTALVQLTSYFFMLSLSPFSIGWSEATRYYHASLLLSERYYGLSLPPFYQDLSRYVVEVVPLLLPHPSLLLERVWEYLLRFLMPAFTVALLLRRLAPARQNRAFWFALLLYGTLFLLQGPVYFYLLFAAIPVLAFFNKDRPALTILGLLIASLWAGISRVNWLPIPAMLAIALYLLEVPIANRSLVRYLLPPALYAVLGLAAAYAARLWYMDISQISPAMFNASFIQQLLWYRLFPSSLNAWGILPSGLLMIAPLFVFVVVHLRKRGARWHWIRIFGLGAMLFVLLAGGFIVSAKIGGGNNLHNLDGFAAIFLTVGFYLLFDRFVPDRGPASAPQAVSPLMLTLAIFAVTMFTTNALAPALPSFDRHEESLASLQQLVDETVANGGSVLFITQRHLLTFGLITGVPLVPEYDNIDLMEFAITNYRPGIDQFHADIAAHKYDMIIAPIPPGRLLEPSDAAFSEENNAWLKRVSIPMLREYKVLATFADGDFVVLVPDE